jgi:hypothetical protein
VRQGMSIACAVLLLLAGACGPVGSNGPVSAHSGASLFGNSPPLTGDRDAPVASNRDFSNRLQEMRERFPPSALGTPEQRAEAADELYARHVEFRRRLGLPADSPVERERLLRVLQQAPGEHAWIQGQAAQREQSNRIWAVREEVSRFDGRQVTAADVARLAANRVNATQPDLPRDQHRAALTAAEADIRRELEDRRRSSAQAAALRREADLTRVAMTGLADMPREITLAAGENLADARSPFDTRPNWRPEPAALRQEEVRLRNAIASRMEGDRRQADQNARAAADAAASHQQADLQRAIEMARADAERERRERQSQRLMEIGFGMMAGANRPPPPSNDGIRTYNVNGRMFTCTTSGTFTNCF